MKYIHKSENLKGNFTKIENAWWTDLRLSDKSLRILGYLISKSDKEDDFKPMFIDLQNRFNISRRTVARCFEELVSLGYAKLCKTQLDGSYYKIYQTPISNEKPIPAPQIEALKPIPDVPNLALSEIPLRAKNGTSLHLPKKEDKNITLQQSEILQNELIEGKIPVVKYQLSHQPTDLQSELSVKADRLRIKQLIEDATGEQVPTEHYENFLIDGSFDQTKPATGHIWVKLFIKYYDFELYEQNKKINLLNNYILNHQTNTEVNERQETYITAR